MNFVKNIFYGNKITELLQTGDDEFKEKNYHSAISTYSNVINFDNSNLDAFTKRGEAYLLINEYKKALTDLEKVESISQVVDPEIHRLLSKIHLFHSNNSKSVKYAEKYSEKIDTAESQYFLARSKYFNKDYKESFEITNILLEKRVNDFRIRYLRSLILFAQQNFNSSINEIDKAITLDSISDFAFNLRALINIQLLNYKEALEDFDYAIRLNPQNALYFFNKGKLQSKIGDLPDAGNNVKHSIQLNPENKSAYLLKAEIELLTESFPEALESYYSALKFDEQDVKLLNQIAGLKIYLLDFEGARTELKKIISFDNEDSNVYLKTAFLEFKLADKNKALSQLQTAIEKNPNFKEAILQKGLLEFSNEKFENAIMMFDLLIKLDQNLTQVAYYKVRSLIRLGRAEEADETLQQIDGNKKDKEFYILSSRINLKLDIYSEAENQLNKFEELNGDDNSTNLIKNILKTYQKKEDTLEIDEYAFDNFEKQIAQIYNAVKSFEDEQYNTAIYRFSNISELSDENKEKVQLLVEYSEGQVS